MNRTLSLVLLAFGLAAATSAAFAEVAPPELPVDVFFDTPAMSALEFSPDGSKILCVVPYKGRQNLAVIDLQKGTKNLLSNFSDRDVLSPFWASNARIVFSVDDGGKEEYSLYAVNADGSSPNRLTPERNVSILRRLVGDEHELLVQAAITHRDWWDVATMNVDTGRLSHPIAKAPGEVAYYVVDHADVVRVAVVRDMEVKANRVLYRDANGQEWREVARFGFDQPGWEPIEFDGDNRTLFVRSDIGRKTKAIYRYDTATGLVEASPVFEDATYDAGSIIYDSFKQKVVGITCEADRLRFLWLDDEYRAIQAHMEKALPNTVHRPVQISKDGSRIIIYSYNDRDPGVYYIYDRKRHKVDELAVIKPRIEPGQMAPMRSIVFESRDGLAIHGYLTLPVGRPESNLPVVVHPHGGPYGPRDDWGYDPEVQFYANRGYAVLQINFRGSGGYGQWFEAAGFKKWGMEMQNDLTDGVNWLVKQGLADPKRVVIAGASYGGYAAMAGLVFTPDLYCAGVNYVGVVDIKNLIPRPVPSRRLYWYHTRIGDLSKQEDVKRLHDTSPVHFADRIRVPLLMAYGQNDPRVPIDQANDIERALKRSRIPYEVIVQKEEGHGFRDENRRIAFYARIDAFLKAHVPELGTVVGGPTKPER